MSDNNLKVIPLEGCRIIIGPDGARVVDEWVIDGVEVIEPELDGTFTRRAIPVTEYDSWLERLKHKAHILNHDSGDCDCDECRAGRKR